MTRRHLGSLSWAGIFLLVLLGIGCGTAPSEGAGIEAAALTTCTLSVTANTYDGPNYWGTVTVKNAGTSAVNGYVVELDVPSGAHCTNDAVPQGATLSPLTGSGSSAHTSSSHCKFTWPAATLAAGAQKTFNYSTDATGFSSAQNVVATGLDCGGGDASGGSNIAPQGAGYVWSQNATPTSNGHRVAAAGINDGNLGASVDCNPAGDPANSWEAAGVVFSGARTVSSVSFVNGDVTGDGDGYLEANLELQVSTDGTTWSNGPVSSWTLDAPYPYSSAASGKAYTFSGSPVANVKGARLAGQVRVRDGSYHWSVKEVRVFGSGGGPACTTAPSTPTGLSAPGKTSSSVTLSWNAVGAPAGCSVSYAVYRDGTLVSTASAPGAVVSGLSPSTTYSFSVAAVDSAGASARTTALSVTTAASGGGTYTPAQVLAGVQARMTASAQVNTQPHINTMTRAQDVNVYQVVPGVFAYTSSMAIDTDGSDPDPDPDHLGETTWQDDSGAQLGAHHVPYYVLGDVCYDRSSPCKWFYYQEHGIAGLQFALMFYGGKCIGAVFGDTQGTYDTSTSDNDARELGEASVKAAELLGIPSSGTTGGVDDGVTVVIFSGAGWVVKGTNATLNDGAQAMVSQALNALGGQMGL